MGGTWTGVGANPSLSSVESIGSMVRVHWSEPMTNDAELVDPTNYAITPTGGGDSVTVLSVTPGPGTNPSYVDLGISNPTTGGSGYNLNANVAITDAAGNPWDGVALAFLGFGSDIEARGTLGIIEAFTGVFGEEIAEVGGFRMTRLTAAVSKTDTTFYVESSLDWPDDGTFAVDGVKYTYTSKSLTAFYGVSHVAAGATVSGAITDHRDEAAVVDLSRQFSALDLLRRGFLVNYAEGDDLNALARNLGVLRPPIFTDDDQFRAVIKAMAYNPRGTVYGLELALEALLGAGNYEVYEDLIQYPNTVFIRVDTSTFLEDTAAGKAFIGEQDWDDLGGTQDELLLSETPLAINRVILYPMGELFDFRDDIPSDVGILAWPNGPTVAPWTYQGSEAEGTAVTLVSGEYTKFVSTTGTVFYRMSDADGARITDQSECEAAVVMRIPSTATVGLNKSQCICRLDDGTRNVEWGLLDVDASNFEIGLKNGAAWVGPTVTLAKDVFHEIVLKKHKDVYAELWVDGVLIAHEDYTGFAVDANHRAWFGLGVVAAGLEVHYKQFGMMHSTVTDYWAARGSAGSVATANPTRFDDTTSLLAAGDVGKYLTISGGTVANGINNGHWLISSYVSPGVVELQGEIHTDAAQVATGPDTVTTEIEDEFTYPDDVGKTIVISGSALGNDGSYTITDLIEAGTGTLYSAYATPITGAKTNVAVVSGGPFTPESNVDYRVDPAFQTEGSLDWVLSDASSFVGNTLTLRDGLWANGLVMEIHYNNVLSAQLLEDEDVENTVGVGPTYSYWPFYLADPLGLVATYMDDLTAAGVIPEFEAL